MSEIFCIVVSVLLSSFIFNVKLKSFTLNTNLPEQRTEVKTNEENQSNVQQ